MNDYFDDDEYYYDFDEVNPDTSGCIEDDWEQDYYDHEIWMEVKAKFERQIISLLEADLYD